uniref:Uncharacterized protein n=1 Tax=Bartonella rochalimae ATCC BAA-1498 TaxID=685782 RepID=E6YKS8_9HYPH|nr:hypothetical protein BARRO_30047 [Bartonella rochalimae ATCC BAA-1498]
MAFAYYIISEINCIHLVLYKDVNLLSYYLLKMSVIKRILCFMIQLNLILNVIKYMYKMNIIKLILQC